jgi:hypothetical protein
MQLLSGGKRAPNRLVIGPAIFTLCCSIEKRT